MKKVAEFLRLVDAHDGQLSLTNVAVLVVLAKIAIAPEVSLVDAGALLVTLVSYQGKKVINKEASFNLEQMEITKVKAEDALELSGELIKRVDEIGSKVTQQQITLGIKDLRK